MAGAWSRNSGVSTTAIGGIIAIRHDNTLLAYTCQAYPGTSIGGSALWERGEDYQEETCRGRGRSPTPRGTAISPLRVLRVRGLRAPLSSVLRGAWPGRPRA